MQTISSFRAADLQPGQLTVVMTDYFALERARIYRRLLVVRFGILALVVGLTGFGLRWLSPVASWLSVGLCAIAPAWAWSAELRYDWRLARRLRDVPGSGPAVPASTVRKS